MNSWGRAREVEKPKTVAGRRAALAEKLQAAITDTEGRRAACAVVFGSLSPVTMWLSDVRQVLIETLAEIDRVKR